MVQKVFVSLMAFMSIFLVLVFVFSLWAWIIRVEIVPDPDFPNDYVYLGEFAQILVQMWRNSIGDVAIFGLGDWSPKGNSAKLKERNGAQNIAMIFIWLVWLANVVGMVIVLLNFVIAEVGQTYEEVRSGGEIFRFQ